MIKAILYTWSAAILSTAACSKKNSGSGPDTPPGSTNPKEMTGILIPLGGNAYTVDMPAAAPDVITKQGLQQWSSHAGFVDAYVRFEKSGAYTLGLRLRNASGNSKIKAEVLGQSFFMAFDATPNWKQYELGKITITEPGYVRIRLQGAEKSGSIFAEVSDLVISGSATNLLFANDPENFYWSRRGPSVHMSYPLPEGNFEYAYGEIMVPVGQDKPGSFFMVNGFGQGYFGIQVRRNDRWVLFSVWDPPAGTTVSVKSGAGVVAQRFGGEGTGGQSYLVYNWKAGETYKFLTRIRPDGAGNTLFSAWFFDPETQAWRFINTWRRPAISTWQSGFHSFLENFYDDKGYLERKAIYKNQWVCSSTGNWVELTQGRHTVDATGNNKQRMDYAGGMLENQFYLHMGGYFNQTILPGTTYHRPANNIPPSIDLSALPEND